MFDGPHFLGQVPIAGMGQAQIGPGQGFGGPPWSVSTPIPPGRAQGYTGQIIAPYGEETELGCYSCPDSGRYELLTRPEALARGCSFAPPGSCPGTPVMAPQGALESGMWPTYARAAPPGLMGRGRNPAFLGEVALFPGPNMPFYGNPPGGYFGNPQGGPLMTEELTSPQEEHIAREFHCYRSPDGQYASVPFAMRDAYLAAGWVATDYRNCSGPPPHATPVGGAPGLYGMGQQQPGGGAPASGPGAPSGPTPSAGTPTPTSAQVQAGQVADQTFFPTFPFYGYPYVYPYGWPAATRQVCTERTDEEGNKVKECHEEPAARPVAYPLVSYPSLFWW